MQAETNRISFLLPRAAGGGVDAVLISFGMSVSGGAGFNSVFCGDYASFRSSRGVWELHLRFFNQLVARFFVSSGVCFLEV